MEINAQMLGIHLLQSIFRCILIGASLSEPHIDRDNGPRARKNGIYIYLCIYLYLCLYHLPRVCRTLVLEIRVRPENLRV